MSSEDYPADLAGALDTLHQLSLQPTAIGGDIEDADFFREVKNQVQQYVRDIDDHMAPQMSSASGRTSRRYDVEDVQDVLDAERDDPRNEDGLPYLLSALHALNHYRSKDMDAARPIPDTDIDPIDTDASTY